MADRIQILPSELIDQIAAGEVVERPASVVKELIENSLDSGASRIECVVQDGGRTLIQVTDDGSGMSRADLGLSVVRHATSKLRSFEDLQGISSLGFRGEALPSIASVSRLEILTRTASDEAGSRLTAEGAGRAEIMDAGAPVGTRVSVRDLFFNTPARRKFLRTPGTEMGHISGWVTRLGLVRPDVHVRLTHNGRQVLQAPPARDLAQRVAALLGREVFEHLNPVQFEQPGVSITGLVSDPEASRNHARSILLFVNGRFVRDRMLQHAVMEAYRTLLPDRRFPMAVLRIDLDPEQVDVNVHPQKTEVRFADTRQVQRALVAAISDVLAGSPWARTLADKPARTYVLKEAVAASPTADGQAERVREAMSRYQAGQQARTSRAPYFPKSSSPSPTPTRATAPESPLVVSSDRPLHDWAWIGTLWSTYILLASGERMVVVDQHAAHERITFEHLRGSIDSGQVRSQRLLIPVRIEVDAASVAVVEEYAEEIARMGLEVQASDDGALQVQAVPALLNKAPVAELVRDVLDELSDMGGTGAWEERRLEVVGRMACHASIWAGQELGEDEIRALLRQLSVVDFASHCPHGRPVLVEWSRSEVAGWFHRT